MPKPVKVRVHYREDAAYLIRLETAIGKDERQTERWRSETCKMVRALSLRLLEVKAGPHQLESSKE